MNAWKTAAAISEGAPFRGVNRHGRIFNVEHFNLCTAWLVYAQPGSVGATVAEWAILHVWISAAMGCIAARRPAAPVSAFGYSHEGPTGERSLRREKKPNRGGLTPVWSAGLSRKAGK
ncbi:MAG TPA: hypothetical protein VEQ63_06140 [Bryobacteraceae bacterium]|nr:hypothetical protein [Bryobacteraceae bacterium]